jgi:hypothetical protein
VWVMFEGRAVWARAGGGMRDADWTRLIDLLSRGEVTPFLGAGASMERLPSGGALARSLADEYGYPFPDHHDLPRVMQYVSSVLDDSIYVKERLVGQWFRDVPPPDFHQRGEPHALLAEFPLPVYLTTNYDDFMVRALYWRRKRPRQAICPWYDDGEPVPRPVTPSAAAPLVYHLHGAYTEPRSLVLTEDDYVEFTYKAMADLSKRGTRIIPAEIQKALSHKVLLFMGYSLRDTTFRTLIRAVPLSRERRHVAVALLPEMRDGSDEESAARYLTAYWNVRRIQFFWGTVQEFSVELRRRMG